MNSFLVRAIVALSLGAACVAVPSTPADAATGACAVSTAANVTSCEYVPVSGVAQIAYAFPVSGAITVHPADWNGICFGIVFHIDTDTPTAGTSTVFVNPACSYSILILGDQASAVMVG